MNLNDKPSFIVTEDQVKAFLLKELHDCQYYFREEGEEVNIFLKQFTRAVDKIIDNDMLKNEHALKIIRGALNRYQSKMFDDGWRFSRNSDLLIVVGLLEWVIQKYYEDKDIPSILIDL